MAKANKAGKRAVRSNVARKTKVVAKKVTTTLGDLVAAAMDTVGNDVKTLTSLFKVGHVQSANGRRIVLV